MSSMTISPRPTVTPLLDCAAESPEIVDVRAAEEAGKVWVNQAGQLPVLASMENLWKITESPKGKFPQLRMNFRATTEDGQWGRVLPHPDCSTSGFAPVGSGDRV